MLSRLILISLFFINIHSDIINPNVFYRRMKILDEKVNNELPNENSFISTRIEEIDETKKKVVKLDGNEIVEDDSFSYPGPYATDLYQGDIMLTNEQLDLIVSDSIRSRRQAQKNYLYPSNIWKNDPIPYSFDSNIPWNKKAPIRAAIKFWEQNTCIRFSENGSGKDRIRFINGNGCWSMIGKIGGEQRVSIGSGCSWIGTIAHELEHAFGVWHTQTRYDRGYYLAVNKENIQSYQMHNFDVQAKENTDLLGIPYEFGSVMHYADNAFAIDSSKPTLVTRNGYERFQDSMSNYLPSFYDIKLINTYYGCYDKCSNKLSCENGGQQDVNYCNQCKCPPGYSGQLCQYTSTKGCDQSMLIGKYPSNFTAVAGSEGLWSYTYTECAIHLKSSDPSKRLKLNVITKGGYSSWNCYGAGVDVRVMKDPAMSGLRLCRPNTKFNPIYSDGNSMVLNLFARVNYVAFEFSVSSY